MTRQIENPYGIHLVGSIPLDSNEEVFKTISSSLGRYVRRIPDGETGIRADWIGWQLPFLSKTPGLEVVPPDFEHYAPLPRVKLVEGFDPAQLKIGNIGYAETALNSWEKFQQLQSEGVIPAHVRFQVCLPTPLATVNFFVMPESKALVEPAYEARMMAELAEITAAIPPEKLSIQWDVSEEFAILEEVWPTFFENKRDEIVERLVRIGNAVPAKVEFGYHLCYGDSGHKHFIQPENSTRLVDIANAVCAGVKRKVNWIHLPVPRDRDDVAYFVPMSGLKLQSGTELYLGLVHYTDGVEGSHRRMAAARQVVRHFGIATECGWGRRHTETVMPLLEIHAELIQTER
jgi:hypothetical protein